MVFLTFYIILPSISDKKYRIIVILLLIFLFVFLPNLDYKKKSLIFKFINKKVF